MMVSRIRFRSFKDLKLSRRTVTGGLAILAFAGMALMARLHSAFIFVVLMAAYLGLGLSEEVLFYRRRRAEERALKAAEPVPLEAEGGARSDEEVLAELGAFDEDEETRAPDLAPRSS
jgi:CDP-diacylglycerol--serine O-phosphatidyltransferase